MLEVRHDIKLKVLQAGRSLADLSRDLGMNYDSLNHYINGRRRMPEGFEERIDSVLKDWSHGV